MRGGKSRVSDAWQLDYNQQHIIYVIGTGTGTWAEEKGSDMDTRHNISDFETPKEVDSEDWKINLQGIDVW